MAENMPINFQIELFANATGKVSLFEPKSTINNARNYPVKRRRFKDVLQEAKKIAVHDYVNDYVSMMVGTGKRGTIKNDRDKDFMDLLEDFEVLMYSRKLQTLLRQRCNDWFCIGDKATDMTPAGAAAETTGTEPTGTQATAQAATQTVLTTTPTTTTTTTSTTEPTTTTVPTTTTTTTEPTTTTTSVPTTTITTEPSTLTSTTEPTTTATTSGEETTGDFAAVTETADIFSVPRWRWRLWLWRWLRWHVRNGWRSRYGWLRRRMKH